MSCTGDSSTSVPQQPVAKSVAIPASELPVMAEDHDPYFVQTTDTISANGPTSITRGVLQDRSGNYWFASWQGIIQYDGETFINHTLRDGLRKWHAFVGLEDKEGILWFGTIGGGVYRYDGTSWTNFTTADGLSNNTITAIYEDHAGQIWFGTDGGASRFDGTAFANFTTEHGMAGNSIYSIIEDRNGNLWFGTDRGVSRHDPSLRSPADGKYFTGITNGSGIPFYNVRSIIEDESGRIWIGGQEGLWCITGNRITQVSTNFIGFIIEDHAGNLWLSESAEVNGSMNLTRYDVQTFTILKTSVQVFGLLEDTQGNIWFGTEQGVGMYDGEKFLDFAE